MKQRRASVKQPKARSEDARGLAAQYCQNARSCSCATRTWLTSSSLPSNEAAPQTVCRYTKTARKNRRVGGPADRVHIASPSGICGSSGRRRERAAPRSTLWAMNQLQMVLRRFPITPKSCAVTVYDILRFAVTVHDMLCCGDCA